jgi:hypothetical protein
MFMARRPAKWRRDSRILADFALEPQDGAAADGAAHRHDERALPSGPALGHRPDDLGDHITAPFDQHAVSDPDVLAADLVLVMERGPADERPGQSDGLEHGHRRQRSRPADLNDDVVDPGRSLSGGELERDRPAGEFGGDAELASRGRVIDLEDDPIDIVIERVALLGPSPPELDDFVSGPAQSGMRIRLEPERLELG